MILQSCVMSPERNGSKIRKVSRSGPAESNETTLRHKITSKELFFSTKMAPVRSIIANIPVAIGNT